MQKDDGKLFGKPHAMWAIIGCLAVMMLWMIFAAIMYIVSILFPTQAADANYEFQLSTGISFILLCVILSAATTLVGVLMVRQLNLRVSVGFVGYIYLCLMLILPPLDGIFFFRFNYLPQFDFRVTCAVAAVTHWLVVLPATVFADVAFAGLGQQVRLYSYTMPIDGLLIRVFYVLLCCLETVFFLLNVTFDVLHIIHTVDTDNDPFYRILFLVVLFLHYNIYPYVLELCLKKLLQPHVMFHVRQPLPVSAFYKSSVGSYRPSRPASMKDLAVPLVELNADASYRRSPLI
jgi:hypothetical protein